VQFRAVLASCGNEQNIHNSEQKKPLIIEKMKEKKKESNVYNHHKSHKLVESRELKLAQQEKILLAYSLLSHK
jgi:hypothetical protein